ncbi:MAG: hypothetical protein WKF89_15850 [Chitinophagaceae bacterium]
MKIEQFVLLSDSEKEKIVFLSGVFVSNYNDGIYLFKVFSLYDFCVSFCYDLNTDLKATIIAHMNRNTPAFCLN